jgi:hypothetical protein
MKHTEESLNAVKKDDLVEIMRREYGFKTYGYAMNTYCNYKKQTLVKLILTFQCQDAKIDNTVTKCLLSKPEIARRLFFAYKITFTPHEINYIPRSEFIVLFNNLIDGVIAK